jgi:hypothetical protein
MKTLLSDLRCKLQGKRNQVSEPAFGHRVLVWEEALIRIEA